MEFAGRVEGRLAVGAVWCAVLLSNIHTGTCANPYSVNRLGVPTGSIPFILGPHQFPYLPEGWAINDDDESELADKNPDVTSGPSTLSSVKRPYYVIAHPTRGVFASLFQANQVVRMANGSSVWTQFSQSDRRVHIDGATGLAFSGGGKFLLVASFATDQIFRFSLKTGKFKGVFSDDDRLDCPEGLLLLPGGDVLVASYLSDTVLRLSGRTGRWKKTFRSSARLDGPQGLALAPDRRSFYVAAWHSNAIVRFNLTGELLATCDTPKLAPLDGPVALALDTNGTLLYASSYRNNKLLRYRTTTACEFFDVFTEDGDVLGPAGLAIAPTLVLHVASFPRNKVLRYSMTKPSAVADAAADRDLGPLTIPSVL